MREPAFYRQVFSPERGTCAMKLLAHNGLVAGSSPAGPTNNLKHLPKNYDALAGLANLRGVGWDANGGSR